MSCGKRDCVFNRQGREEYEKFNVFTPQLSFILCIHSRPFCERFADEMRWIFDEECRRGAAPRLLCDSVLSLLRQHAKSNDNPEPTATGFGLLITSPGISSRFVQAGLIASILLVGFMLLLGKTAKPLIPFRLPGTTHRPDASFKHLRALKPSQRAENSFSSCRGYEIQCPLNALYSTCLIG